MSEPTLDCQTCGKVLRVLSPAENQQVALNPQNFIVYCERHQPMEGVGNE